jgi:hypothetical protein
LTSGGPPTKTWLFSLTMMEKWDWTMSMAPDPDTGPSPTETTGAMDRSPAICPTARSLIMGSSA